MPTLRLYGDPALRRKAAPVARFDESLRTLAQEMTEVMHDHAGVGLAANQVGADARIIVVDLSGGERAGEAFALVNPRVTWREGVVGDEEGCLSFPGLRFPVRRAMAVRVEGQDLAGQPVIHEARGLLARVFQHEIDHLDGVLFFDRLPWRKRLAIWLKLPRLKAQYRALRPA